MTPRAKLYAEISLYYLAALTVSASPALSHNWLAQGMWLVVSFLCGWTAARLVRKTL